MSNIRLCLAGLIFLVYYTIHVTSFDRNVLSEAITETWEARSAKHLDSIKPHSNPLSSYMEGLCSNLLNKIDRERVACCPNVNGGILYLHNVQILNGKIVFFTGRSEHDGRNLDGTAKYPAVLKLPPIKSVIRRKVTEFSLPVEVRNQNFPIADCKSYFNGTLHVIGRQTTQNLYHTMNDNILPLLTLIAFDMALQPDLLRAPRAMLTGFHPAADPEQVPHLEGILRAAIPHHMALGKQVEGMCFRRVAWGGGVKVMYQHLLGKARHISANLLREIVLRAFSPPSPYNIVGTSVLAGRSRRLSSDGGGDSSSSSSSRSTSKEAGGVGGSEWSLGVARGTTAAVVRNRQTINSIGHHDSKRRDFNRRGVAIGPGVGIDAGVEGVDVGNYTQDYSLRLKKPQKRAKTVTRTGSLMNAISDTLRSSSLTAAFASVPISKSVSANPLLLSVRSENGQRRPLNVVIYTRGSSGFGRVLPGEDLLRERLNALGASALICCNFRNVSLSQQLGYAVHADVVLGLHGAGLVNTVLAPEGVVTVELKTIYGYGLTLFALAAEARKGTFIELDVRDHHIWGKPGQSRNRPVDDALIERVVQALTKAIEKNENRNAYKSKADLMRMNFQKELFVALPRPLNPLPLPQSSSSAAAAAASFSSAPSSTRQGKALGGGDLMVLPYPATAVEVARPPAVTESAATGLTGVNASALDFLFHILGPTVREAPSQCASMTLSKYWEYVSEKGVKDKYCITCQM